MNIEQLVEDINNSEDGLVFIHISAFGGQDYALLKRDGKVSYNDEESTFKNLKGLGFQVDNDWEEYGMRFDGSSGFCVSQESITSPDEVSNYQSKIMLGEKNIIKYLREINQWEEGINFKDKWTFWLQVIDTYINCKLK